MIRRIIISALKKATKLLRGKNLGEIPGSLAVYKFFALLLSPKVIDVQGSKMYLDKAYDKISCCAFVTDSYMPLMTDIFKKSLKRGDIVVDAGAYVGYYSLLAARIVGEGGKVYAFEPEPLNFGLSNKNIQLNGYNNIIPVQKAISKECRTTKLFISKCAIAHSLESQRAQDIGRGFIEVETTSLDEFFKNKDYLVDVIKIDVEGAEMEALLGMGRIIKQNRNLKMFVQCRLFRSRKPAYSAEEFLLKLWGYNFLTSIINEEEKCLKPINALNQLSDMPQVVRFLFVERKREHNE